MYSTRSPFWFHVTTMLSADGLIDGSYDVTVHVTDMNIEKSIRVRGDVHVGGLMLRISNALS